MFMFNKGPLISHILTVNTRVSSQAVPMITRPQDTEAQASFPMNPIAYNWLPDFVIIVMLTLSLDYYDNGMVLEAHISDRQRVFPIYFTLVNTRDSWRVLCGHTMHIMCHHNVPIQGLGCCIGQITCHQIVSIF